MDLLHRACMLFASTLILWGCSKSTAAPEPEPEPTTATFYETGLPRSLDPHKAGDVVSTRHALHVYETLLDYKPFGETRLQPCLAESLPEYDTEKMTYTFTLRDDVYFADHKCFKEGKGRKLTAGDVVYSFKRLAALPDSGGYWVIEGKITGLGEFRYKALEHIESDQPISWMAHLDSDVAGIKALDESRVQFTLTEPYPQFLYAITLSYGAVVPHEAAKKHDYRSIAPDDDFKPSSNLDMNVDAVGTGPYRLVSYDDDQIVYKRNPHYRAVALNNVPENHPLKRFEGDNLPLTDILRYRVIEDPAASFQAFLEGELVAIGLDREQFDEVISAEALAAGKYGDDLLKEKYRKKGIHLLTYNEPTLHYISFNMEDETFGAPAGDKGRALRKAIALSIDRNRYINDFLNGRGEAASQLVPSGMLGHDDGCKLVNQTFDPEKARKLLKEAGFTVTETNGEWSTTQDGKQVRLTVVHRSTREATKDYAVFLTESAALVGIKLENELMTFAEFLKRQDEGTGQAYDAGWVMDYPDAQNMLQLLYSPNKAPGINSARFDDDEYDVLYREMAVMREDVGTHADAKRDLIMQMHHRIDTETPWVLMEYRKIFTLFNEGYASPPPNPFAYNSRKYVHWNR